MFINQKAVVRALSLSLAVLIPAQLPCLAMNRSLLAQAPLKLAEAPELADSQKPADGIFIGGNEGVRYKKDGSKVLLYRGSLIVGATEPANRVSVCTRLGTIYVSRGATALVSVGGEQIKVRSLKSPQDGINVVLSAERFPTVEDRDATLPEGQQLLAVAQPVKSASPEASQPAAAATTPAASATATSPAAQPAAQATPQVAAAPGSYSIVPLGAAALGFTAGILSGTAKKASPWQRDYMKDLAAQKDLAPYADPKNWPTPEQMTGKTTPASDWSQQANKALDSAGKGDDSILSKATDEGKSDSDELSETKPAEGGDLDLAKADLDGDGSPDDKDHDGVDDEMEHDTDGDGVADASDSSVDMSAMNEGPEGCDDGIADAGESAAADAGADSAGEAMDAGGVDDTATK